jgi:hypothetical protein
LALPSSVHFSDTRNGIRNNGFAAPLVLNVDNTRLGGGLYEPDALFSGKGLPSPMETRGCVGSKRIGCCEEQKNLLVIPGIESRFLGHRAIYTVALLRTDYIKGRKFVL